MSTTTTSSTVSVSSPPPPTNTPNASPSPAFSLTVPEMFTCGATEIHWTYGGAAAPLTLNISNINVAQPAPYTPPATSTTSSSSSNSSSTAPATITSAVALLAKRQFNGYGGSYLPSINMILARGLDPTATSWQWNTTTVPQGWYQILANVQGVLQTSSSPFFVLNGSNTGCVPQFAFSTPVSSLSASSSTQGAGSTMVATSSGHSHAGAIAGGVIGGIAFFSAAIVAFLYFCLRRRSRRSNLRDEYDSSSRPWSMLSFNRSRSGTYARSSVQKHPLPTLDANQTFVGTDDELSTIAHEKAIAAALPGAAPFQPTRSRSQRGSTQTNASHSNAVFNTESPVRRTPSYRAQPIEAIPLERTQTNQSYNRPNSNSEPPVSRSGAYAASQTAVTLERTPTGGGGSRRKPAPSYEDAAQAEAEAERARNTPSHTTPSSSLGTTNDGSGSLGDHHLLRHQNSFGAMRPMHVMMPDPPQAAHN